MKWKNTIYFKFLAGVLIFLFFAQIQTFPLMTKGLEQQFQKAVLNYENGNYKEAKIRLSRIAVVMENLKHRTDGLKKKYGQVLLLIGACYEKTKVPFEAKAYYEKGLWESSDSQLILQSEMNVLPIYKEVFKCFKKSGIIVKKGKVKNKKKKKILMWVGGAVVLGLVLLFVLKKKKEHAY